MTFSLVSLHVFAEEKHKSVFITGIVASLVIGLIASLFSLSFLVLLGVFVVLVSCSLVSPVAALSVLLILAPLRTLIATEAQYQLPLDIGQFAFLLFVICWFGWRVVRGLSPLPRLWTSVSLSLVVFLIAVGLSIFSVSSFSAWLTESLKWLQLLFIMTIVVNIAAGDRKYEWVIFVLVVSGVANALIGAYEFLGGSGALHLLINDRFFRAFGTFGQPNPFGGFMGMLIPLSLVCLMGYIQRSKSSSFADRVRYYVLLLFYLFASIALIIGLLMSWSRGAWLGLLGALLVAFFMLPRKHWHGMILFVVMMVTLMLVCGLDLLPSSVLNRLGASTQEIFMFEDIRGTDITPLNFAVVERLAHWQAALNMLLSHPLLGVGFGNYEVVYDRYRLLNWSESLGHAHNYYLNILAEVGILGLLGYGKVLINIITVSWRGSRHPDALSRLVVIGILCSWVYIIIHSVFDNLYVNNLFLHMGVMLGILVLLCDQSNAGMRIVE